MKDLYDQTRKLSGKQITASKPIKDASGNKLIEQDQLKRWGEYFKESIAITKQKNGKAPGPDGIPAEVLKADINTSMQMLYEI